MTTIRMLYLDQISQKTYLERKTTIDNFTCSGMAIIGDKCVYLDKNDRYGGYLSCFNLEHFFRFVDTNIEKTASQEGYRDFQVMKPYNLSAHKTEQDFKRVSR